MVAWKPLCLFAMTRHPSVPSLKTKMVQHTVGSTLGDQKHAPPV